MNDYYKTLGVSKTASQEEIKRAYRALAHQHHPDKGGGDEKKFKEINEAYQVLSDKDKRAQYDRFGRVFDGVSGMPGYDGVWPDFRDFDFREFSGFSGPDFDFEEMVEDFFGAGGHPFGKRDLRRGSDINIDIEIPLEAMLKGFAKKVKLKKFVLCSRCQGIGAEPGTKINECFACRGTGQVQQIKRTFFGSITRTTICPECAGEGKKPEKPCNVCAGEGRVRGEEEIEVMIPAGADSNQIFSIKGKGNAGKKGGKSGDIFARVFIKPHKIFERRGDDIFLEKEISFSQAALGDEIEISTLDGKDIILKIPAGTSSGKFFRISGKGIPHFSGFGRGNLYVRVIIETPTRLTKKQKELLKELKKHGL